MPSADLFNGAGFHANVAAYLDTPGIFSLYGSGLISTAFFSMLEFDADGNVNLLRHGTTWVGPGGRWTSPRPSATSSSVARCAPAGCR